MQKDNYWISHFNGVYMNKLKKQYTVQLEDEFVDKLDKMADKLGVSRSQLMRNLMENGYDDVVMLDKIGMIAAFKFGQKLISKIREGIASGKITLDEKEGLKIRKEE
jgi:predicted DNA-binding protein